MADTKISALTGATTPVAGTEVLPIVQSSTTVNVSIANLTAGRAISAASLTLTTTPLSAANGGTGVTASTGASSVVLRDTNANITANSITPGWTSTTTAAGTTTLTVASTYYQRFIGSTTQTVVLPSATTVALGQGFIIDNDSSGNLTLQDGSAGALGSIVAGMAAFIFCENNSTTAGSWSGYMFVPGSGPGGQVTWGTAGLSMGGQTISSSTWNGTAIGATYGGTGVANNAASTITISGNYASTFVVSGAYSYTLPAATDTLVNLGSSQTLTSKTLTNPTVTNYVETLQAVGTVGSTSTLALTTGTVLTATLTASTPCTFTMPTATAGKSFILKLTQAATGMTTATFTSVKWPGGTAPTITATASAVDILSFVSDGTKWYGTFAQAFA